MKIMQVIHGYPMRYNAGSEVYTQSLCHALADRNEVHVFTREEDSFAPDFQLRVEQDVDDPRITLHVVNNPRNKDRYRDVEIDQQFVNVVEHLKPDVVHIGHLNHLSTSLVAEAAHRKIPIIYTLHDYWLMCPRGQFMQTFPEDPKDLWAVCAGQEDYYCAKRCYARSFSGSPTERDKDSAYWAEWIGRRMAHVRKMADLVQAFIAPSHFLLIRFRDAFKIPEEKLHFLDYGFDLKRLCGRVRTPDEPFTFGYIGSHLPAKGIQNLIEAFGQVRGKSLLRIWGRSRGQDTVTLRNAASQLPGDAVKRIDWFPEYRNQDIVTKVFNRVDAIVVPSIWIENSPLVIHEALQARIPVITADVGGMAEYVHHEVNGLLFAHRDAKSLAIQMQRLADDPAYARILGQRGYIQSATGDVPGINAHAGEIERIYAAAISVKGKQEAPVLPGPWRLTFDTNPDDCNLHCIMCEEHSPYRKQLDGKGNNGNGRRRMPIELLERTIQEAVPFGLREVIPSTMGEPLLYKHFDRIIEICRAQGVKLNLTTNGTFPWRGAREWAERIVPVTSDVKISVNGAMKETQEEIMRGSRWGKIIDNIRTFVAVRDTHAADGGNRCRVTFQITFLEINIGELADIVRLAVDLGVDRIKGHHVWPHFPEIESLSMKRDTRAIQRWNEAICQAHAASLERPLPGGQFILLENFFPLKENGNGVGFDGPCPFLGREAWVNTEGRFDPCCAPDALRQTLGRFGSVEDPGLMTVWRGAEYQELLRTYCDRALCRTCNMRRPKEVS